MKRWAALVVLVLFAAVAGGAVHAPKLRVAPRTVWDSVYTADQATRGQVAYGRTCSRCHQPSLGGADDSPALAGGGFLGNWGGQTLYAVQDRIKTSMPTDDPGTYKRELITDVLAYILKVNGFPAGRSELSPETDSLKAIVLQTSRP